MRYCILVLSLLLSYAAYAEKPDFRPLREALEISCNKQHQPQCSLISADAEIFSQRVITHFTPKLVSDEGLLTGYYLPLVEGSYAQSADYSVPVYGVPEDFSAPYLTRKQIDNGALEGKETPILWLKDRIELFFLQVQGSGRVLLPDGSVIGLGFAAKNGQPYASIGKLLVKEGQIDVETASMQSIKAWLRQHPEEIDRVLWHNPSYIFFQLQDAPQAIGAQGVPLTPYASVAVDPSVIPYGSLVRIDYLNENNQPERSVYAVAQDTGSAIKGPNRMDFFLGFGQEAEEVAGKLKARAKFWVLQPKALHD